MSERQWRDLVDTLPEPMTCPRRQENGMDVASPLRHSGPNLDRWEKFKSNGDRVCSYCGSLHWEDFKLMVKASAEAPEDASSEECTQIEQSDKGYKIYVRRRGVSNAHDGGIKFYTPHIDPPPTVEDNNLYSEAVRRSGIRNRARLNNRFPVDGEADGA